MKIRNGFVSNSSSSSFVILKKYLSEEQIKKIKNHIEYCVKENLFDLKDTYNHLLDEYISDYPKEKADQKAKRYIKYNEWNITEWTDIITGGTSMDNFNMYEFMETIGVPLDKVKWRD